MTDTTNRAIITDKVVVAQTGATLEEWFRHLDDLGARKMSHINIFNLIAGIDGLKPLGQWNQNLLTTSYEWDRGLKARGQKGDGFEISVSKTLNVPVAVLYGSFVDAERRKKWLSEAIEVTKQTENKSARALWIDGQTRVSVDFYPKGALKSQIVVQHMKIADSQTATEMKEFWAAKLTTLKGLLEN